MSVIIIQSDHSLIFIKISPLQETVRGPGYWKFNSSLVNDQIFVEKTKEIINEVAVIVNLRITGLAVNF